LTFDQTACLFCEDCVGSVEVVPDPAEDADGSAASGVPGAAVDVSMLVGADVEELAGVLEPVDGARAAAGGG